MRTVLEREPLTRHRTEILMLLYIVFRNFLYFAQSRGSFDAIAFLLQHHDRACLSLIRN